MRKKRTVRQRKKSFFSFLRRGDIAITLILGVVVLGAIILAGGIFPELDDSKVNKDIVGEIDTSSVPTNQNDKSLQIQKLKIKTCNDQAAIDFLIDTSGSMNFGGGVKLTNLKQAMQSFAANFNDKTVVGIRRFSGENKAGLPVTSRLVPINFYLNNKSNYNTAVNSLSIYGGTMTRNAFSNELTELSAAVANSNFNTYNFNLIFFTDGIPETSDNNMACPGGGTGNPFCIPDTRPGGVCRCFDSAQDPTTTTNGNIDIAAKIKALRSGGGKNVRIFSIVILDDAADGHFKDKVENMMKKIASDPATDYFFTTSATDFKNIFRDINQKICTTN